MRPGRACSSGPPRGLHMYCHAHCRLELRRRLLRAYPEPARGTGSTSDGQTGAAADTMQDAASPSTAAPAAGPAQPSGSAPFIMSASSKRAWEALSPQGRKRLERILLEQYDLRSLASEANSSVRLLLHRLGRSLAEADRLRSEWEAAQDKHSLLVNELAAVRAQGGALVARVVEVFGHDADLQHPDINGRVCQLLRNAQERARQHAAARSERDAQLSKQRAELRTLRQQAQQQGSELQQQGSELQRLRKQQQSLELLFGSNWEKQLQADVQAGQGVRHIPAGGGAAHAGQGRSKGSKGAAGAGT